MTKYGIDPTVICQIIDLANNLWINSVLCHHTNSFDKPSSSLTVLAIISQNNYTTKCHLHKQYFDACVPEAGIDRYNKNGRAALRKEAARSAFCRWPCSDGIYLGISYLKAALRSARSPAVLS